MWYSPFNLRSVTAYLSIPFYSSLWCLQVTLIGIYSVFVFGFSSLAFPFWFQDSLEFHPNLSPAQSPGPNSNPFQLDQPYSDDRMHNRRPSDEATIILRKISGAGPPPPLGMCNMGMSMPDRTGSLPHGYRGLDGLGIFGNFDDFRYQTLGIGCTM